MQQTAVRPAPRSGRCASARRRGGSDTTALQRPAGGPVQWHARPRRGPGRPACRRGPAAWSGVICHGRRPTRARPGQKRPPAASGAGPGGRPGPDTWPCGAVASVRQTHRPTPYVHTVPRPLGQRQRDPDAALGRLSHVHTALAAEGAARTRAHTRVCPPRVCTRAWEQGGHMLVGRRRRCSVAQVTTGPAAGPSEDGSCAPRPGWGRSSRSRGPRSRVHCLVRDPKTRAAASHSAQR